MEQVVVPGEPSAPATSTWLDVDGQRLHARRAGQGPPLVLLHANPGDSRDFDAVVAPLGRRYTVVALDWPGFGASPAPARPDEVTPAALAALVPGVVRALGLGPAVLLGNSVGGWAAIETALGHPELVAGVVAVSPGGYLPMAAPARAMCRAMGAPRVGARLAGPLARGYLRRRTPVTREMLARARALDPTDARARVHSALWRAFASPDHDRSRRREPIAVPSLVLWGLFDPVTLPVVSRPVAARVHPGTRQRVLRTGHAPFAEAPDAFLAALRPVIDLS